jgi:hypothetical protein
MGGVVMNKKAHFWCFLFPFFMPTYVGIKSLINYFSSSNGAPYFMGNLERAGLITLDVIKTGIE